MYRLAHISDVHLGPLPKVSARQLASKRITGFVNWQRNRARQLQDGVLNAIIAELGKHDADHLAITGDLVNLALDAEIAGAKRWLETLGNPADVSVIPGNHDSYVPGALDRAIRSWSPWLGDGPDPATLTHPVFPTLRIRGGVALVGCSSAQATAPFMANGFFRRKQANRLARILDDCRERGLCRIVMIHHPPVRGAAARHKRLFGIGRFQQIIRRHGAELVIHGHTHVPSHHEIAGDGRNVPVIGVSAGGQAPDGKHAPASFNLFDISRQDDRWRIALQRVTMTTLTGAFAVSARQHL